MWAINEKYLDMQIEKGKTTPEEGFLALEHFWAGALRRAVQEGDVDRGSLMAGEIVYPFLIFIPIFFVNIL